MMYAQLINWERPKHYRSYRAIEQWVIRNLMSYGNCYMKNHRFYDVKEDFERLFGKRGIKIQEVDSRSVVISITEKAKEKALPFVLY